jgi:hypothetical protein
MTLPAVNHRSVISKAATQVVVGGLDIFHHDGVQRLKLPESLAQVLVGIDFFVPASRLGMHYAIDAVPQRIPLTVKDEEDGKFKSNARPGLARG